MTKQGGDLHQHDADAGADADAGGTHWHEDDVWCAEFAHPDKHAGLKTRTPALQRLESLGKPVCASVQFFFLFVLMCPTEMKLINILLIIHDDSK